MTEESLFRTTLITLSATILGPLVVASTNAAGTDDSAGDKLKNYVAAAQQTTADKKDDKTADKKDDAEKNDAKSDESAKNEDGKTADNKHAAVPGNATAKKAGSYTVKDGDTYGCIAEEYYGSYDQWTRVYDANAGWPGFNEYDLAVGAKLQMPAVDASQVLPKTNLCQ